MVCPQVRCAGLFFVALSLAMVSLPQNNEAETIVMNSGEEIKGRIVRTSSNDKTITLDVGGKLMTLALTDIADIKEVREWAGPSTQPMYGGLPRSQADQENDAQLIQEATEHAGSREAASRELMKAGWDYYDRDDLSTAMKRFNQAWLLDPRNPDVFWGFGSVSLAQRNADQAIEMFQKAVEIHPQHAVALCSLGSTYQFKAHAVRWSKEKSAGYLQQSDHAFQQGSQADPQEEFCYSAWAGTLFLQQRYAEAWEKIGMARRLGGRTINRDFLQDLSAAMPEPPPH